MLLKNVVLIETINNTGTGLIYPCDYRNNKNSFIVITNSHVIEEFRGEKDDYKDDIYIHFYDDLGNKIDRDEIEFVKLFNKSTNNCEEDIAALLVVLKNDLVLTLEKNIYNKPIDNREKIVMEGYPGVMLNDDIYQKIQIEGQEKSMFPENEKIGIYQITDDYHWYNNLNDKKVIEGLSGSPVYYMRNNKKYILGISQSVSDIYQGENPFKIIYYLKMKHILNYLRDNNCIIYSQTNEFEYKIVWTFDDVDNDNNEEITMFMIGSSGSGKSSFAKNFAYLGDKINSTSDGQTTRTKVIYEYSLFPKESKATIKLLRQDDFATTMLERLEFSFFKKYIIENLNLDDKNVETENFFLNNVQAVLRMILSNDTKDDSLIKELINNIWIILRGESSNVFRCDVYENIVLELNNRIGKKYLKFVIDENYIKSIFDNFRQNEYLESDSDAVKIIEKIKLDYDSSGNVDFKKFEELQIYFINKIDYEKVDIIKNNKFSYEYITKNVEELFRIEGYFDVDEFSFMFPKKHDLKDKLNKGIKSKEKIEKIEKIEKNDETHLKVMSTVIDEIYKEMHRQIKSFIRDEYDFDDKKGNKIDLTKMNDKEQMLIEQSLKVTPKGSLTGIIDYVNICDKISNEYAMIMWELGISKIRLIDTCGLDHIQVYDKAMIKENIKKTLSDNESAINLSYSETNILYFKKLDSGKPDELRNILPIIREVIPASPVYCVFTGVDIFYRTLDEVKALSWKQESKNNPKAINYIFSEKGRNNFINEEESSSYSMYLTLKNNLVAYCGLKELEQNEFEVYASNVKHIRKMIASITMKEYSSLEIIDNSDSEANLYSELKSEVEDIIRELFSRASIHDKYYRWNTIKADISVHNYRQEFGYAGTYFHRINQLFHQSYADIMNDSNIYRKILKKDKFEKTQSAVYSALKNMENKFIGNYYSLTMIDSPQKSEFRNIMESMYESYTYKYNPFEKNADNDKFISKDVIENRRDSVFTDIFNFKKGLENSGVLERFTLEFVKCLKVQIDEDNEKKSKNMMNLNQEFVDHLSKLKTEFIEKYSDKESDEETEKKFKQLMSYYFIEK